MKLLTKLTLKRAKELARYNLGRLPRAGHEYIILNNGYYTLALVNSAGKFYLREYIRPFCADYEAQQMADIASRY